MVDLVTQLRQLEGINTSFDYGVEIVVFAVKEGLDWENISAKIIENEKRYVNVFAYDRVCYKGFKVAKQYFKDVWNLNKHYLHFIREFKYDKFVYAMISEFVITLNAEGMGGIWKQEQIEELSAMLESQGFTFVVNDKSSVVEIVVTGLDGFSL